MKAMILNSYGDDAQFTQVEMDKPAVKAGHVLVRIQASSVNTVDTMIHAMGADLPLSPALPAVLGMDFAGIVDAVGDGVTGYQVGDEIYGCAGGLADLQGSLADYMVADANLIAHKPASLSMQQAAAIPLVGITALEGLQRAGLTPQSTSNTTTDKKTILIHGGAGGVGHIAVQLAVHMGADVYATGTGPDQLALIEKLGATAIDFKTETVDDYVTAHTGGTGFDVVFDTVGGPNMANSFQAAALNGQIVTTVSMIELDLTPAHFKGLSVHVVFMLIPMLHNHRRSDHHVILSTLADITQNGGLTPVLDSQDFNITQVGQAYDRLKSGNAMGKIVVTH